MSTKVAKVIAFELGILIAILTWMALPDLRTHKSNRFAKLRPETDQSFATVSPILQPARTRPQALDYPAEETTDQLEEAEPIQTVERYDQEVAAEPSVDSGYVDYAAAPDPANYIGDYPEPVLDEPDCYATTYPIVSYQQPVQLIVLSTSRSLGRRHQVMSRSGGRRVMIAPRRQAQSRSRNFGPRRNSPPHISAVPPRRIANTRSRPMGQGIRTAWNR